MNGGESIPSPRKSIIPRNTSDRNFKRAILFSIVERSSNYVFGDTNHPTVLRAKGCKFGNSFIGYTYCMLLRTLCVFELYFPRWRSGFGWAFQRTVRGSVDLNLNTFLCILSKRCNIGITGYINLENSGNDKGDCQFSCCQYDYSYDHYYFETFKFTISRKSKDVCACTLSK